jgi:hypothetical protein
MGLSAVIIYNANSSLVRFVNKYFSSTLSNALAYIPSYYNVGAVVVNSELVGLAPEKNEETLETDVSTDGRFNELS